MPIKEVQGIKFENFTFFELGNIIKNELDKLRNNECITLYFPNEYKEENQNHKIDIFTNAGGLSINIFKK
jgi:hypothetical protein